MLTDEQLEIISDTLTPLFQYLEKEVIADIARRIQKTLTYTRTAELQAMSMKELGYSPAKIRKEAMKLLNADLEYRKAVAKNTLEYKKEIRNIINNITKEAYKANNDIVANAGNMAWVDDLSVWKDAGKELEDNSFLQQLVDAFSAQTAGELKNITQTTGFKTMSGYEAVENAYKRELDKAVIKICSGTFSQNKAVCDAVHNLAQSGLRSVDFASGYSMQLDTAARVALRTGCHQLAGKIIDKNLEQTGENLVYVSEHWGARNTGTGHANHEQWQGKVYFIKDGQDYSDEAERIGQDRITSLYYATGYSIDGENVSDPLGLYGYNCRHSHYVWFKGVSSLPKKTPEPSPATINGKTYDYYAMTQKMRSMERSVRALKREKEALKALGMDTKEIQAKISRKTAEYREFCNVCRINPQASRLRYECGTSDLKKTQAWKDYEKMSVAKSNDIGKQVFYDASKNYEIKLKGYSPEIIESLSKAAREVADEGSKTRYEHMALVDMNSGNIVCRHTDGLPNQVGGKMLYDYLKENPDSRYAFIHNHNTATELSLGDVELIVNNKQIDIIAAVRNDGIITVVESNGKKAFDFLPLRYDEQRTKYKEEKYGKIVPSERSAEYSLDIELFTRDLAIEEFSKGGMMTYE